MIDTFEDVSIGLNGTVEQKSQSTQTRGGGYRPDALNGPLVSSNNDLKVST
jgi:hypothetical protein